MASFSYGFHVCRDGGYSEREEEDEAVGILSSNSASIAGFDPQQ